MRRTQDELRKATSALSRDHWCALAVGGALAVATLVSLETDAQTRAAYALIALCAPGVLLHFTKKYLASRKLRQIDGQLPGALLYAASLPHRTSIEKVITDLSRPQNGALGEVFKAASMRIRAGESVPEALQAMLAANPSRLLRRAVDLFTESYQSGADMSRALSDVAEDSLAVRALQLESKGSLAIYKYTILLGGGLLVPAIMGILLTVAASLQSEVGAFGMGAKMTLSARAGLADAVVGGAQGYLGLFALIAGSFVALQENEPKKAVFYFLVLLPVSIAVFHLARSLRI